MSADPLGQRSGPPPENDSHVHEPVKIVLFEPEIPPNTGSIIRLAANTGAQLHLIEPLGFELDHVRLRRAGLDYHEFAQIEVHASLADFRRQHEGSLYGFSTRGQRTHDAPRYTPTDALLFGPESRGLPPAVLEALPCESVLRIPMRPDVRSLNLANAVAVAVYEALRQQGFPDLG